MSISTLSLGKREFNNEIVKIASFSISNSAEVSPILILSISISPKDSPFGYARSKFALETATSLKEFGYKKKQTSFKVLSELLTKQTVCSAFKV